MHQNFTPPASTRPGARRRAAIAVATFALLTGCASSTAAETNPNTSGASAAAPDLDRSSQPLEAVVIDSTVIVDGAGATRLMDVSLWVANHRREKCGGQGSFMVEGDRYDQQMFPDFDLIEREGLGIGRPTQEPEPAVEPADEACIAATLPELSEADKVFGEWTETIVYPTWAAAEVTESAAESAACVSEEMGWGEVDLTLETVLPTADSMVIEWGELGRSEAEERVATLDRQLSAVLATCAKDTYDLFTRLLEAQRGPFLDRHSETLAAAAAALDEAGYTP